MSRYRKLGEIPYDFIRKRLTVLVAEGSRHFMTTKRAPSNVLSVCSLVETGEGRIEEIAVVRQAIDERFKELSVKGFRTLGVAYRDVGDRPWLRDACHASSIQPNTDDVQPGQLAVVAERRRSRCLPPSPGSPQPVA